MNFKLWLIYLSLKNRYSIFKHENALLLKNIQNMIVKTLQDITEHNLGVLLGKPELGTQVRRLTNKKIGEDHYEHNFLMEHYIIEPGGFCSIQSRQQEMISFVINGAALFEGKGAKLEVFSGNIVYTHSGEIVTIKNIGGDKLEIIYCTDSSNKHYKGN